MCYTNLQYKNRLKKLADIQAEIDRLQAEADAIKEDIKTDMGDAEHVVGDDFKISWVNIMSQRFDTKRFQADHDLLYRKYVVPSVYRRFSYSLK